MLYVAGLGSKQCTTTVLSVLLSPFSLRFESLHTPPSLSIFVFVSRDTARIASTSDDGLMPVPGLIASRKPALAYPLLQPTSSIRYGRVDVDDEVAAAANTSCMPSIHA